jgi:hypothetical protein
MSCGLECPIEHRICRVELYLVVQLWVVKACIDIEANGASQVSPVSREQKQ